MELPFTTDQFLGVFAAFNRLLWPAVAVLWLSSVMATIALLRRSHSTAVAALLAIHWLWSAIAYHFAFFSAINPAAYGFAALFALQAALIPAAYASGRLRFMWQASPRRLAGLLLCIYALAYPLTVLALGHQFPAAPLFGVPCPTTLFTAGAFLMTARPVPWWLALVPVAWSIIGGSAALLLGVHADLALFLAGALLGIDVIRGLRRPARHTDFGR